MNGILVLAMIIVIGICLGPLGIFLKLGPVSQFIQYKCPHLHQNYFMFYILQTAARFVLVTWFFVESSRVYVTMLVPGVTLFRIYTELKFVKNS